MAKAPYRDVYGKTQGRFVISEGIAPSEYLHPHEELPTLYVDYEDSRFEVVITKGTILQLYHISEDGAADEDDAYLVPCNGSDSNRTLNGYAYDGTATSIVIPPGVPIGVAQYDLYRQFDYATSQGAGWITHAYVEYPMINGVNDDLVPGDLVMPDSAGRPTIFELGVDAHYLVCGQVIRIERFATNFDDGLLSYMEIPPDKFNTALEEVYEITKAGDYTGLRGIRGNLDVEDVLGAVRVLLKF